tara:strand:+ start:16179 stop:16637 length:459 start_codon:yes stop_codon:yes gene_type:complete
MSVYEPPKAKKWQKAERWKVGLWDNRYPLCGLRLLWVLIGTKHVQMSAPICLTKMRMSRKEWNKLKDKARMHTEEDLAIDKERRDKVWNQAQAQRIAIENGTYVKPKRKYKKKQDSDDTTKQWQKLYIEVEETQDERPKKIQSALDKLASLR